MTGPETIELILAGHGVKLEREYRFNSARRWRADFAVISDGYKILIEYHGGTWTGGKHIRPAGMSKDFKKHNSAVCLGYRVLYYTADMLRDNPGRVLDDVLTIIKGAGNGIA
jgi:very-short-patch-repair endonuclease